MIEEVDVDSLSVGERLSPRTKNTVNSKQLSLSFTSPPSDTSCEYAPGVSPRQASISMSYTSNITCPLDYSTDNEVDLALRPISPLSPCEDDKHSHDDESWSGGDLCEIPLVTGASQQGSKYHLSTSTPHVGTNNKNNDKNCSENRIAKTNMAPSQDNDIYNISEQAKVSMLSRRYSDCNKRNNSGQSALSISSSKCFLRGMMILIEKGADVNLLDMYGRSPLHLACENTVSLEHHACVLYLLENGADANIQDVFGRSALHIAARNGCYQCIQLILDHGARTDLEDSDGNTPLHISAKHDQTDAMEALITDCYEEQSYSSVESVNEYYFSQKRDENSSVIYRSPLEYYGAKLNNDSSYFSTRSHTWARNNHYIPHNIEEREVFITEDGNTDIGNTSLFDSLWFFTISFLPILPFFRILLSKPKQSHEGICQQEIKFTEPPDHVFEAMERFKQSRLVNEKY